LGRNTLAARRMRAAMRIGDHDQPECPVDERDRIADVNAAAGFGASPPVASGLGLRHQATSGSRKVGSGALDEARKSVELLVCHDFPLTSNSFGDSRDARE